MQLLLDFKANMSQIIHSHSLRIECLSTYRYPKKLTASQYLGYTLRARYILNCKSRDAMN